MKCTDSYPLMSKTYSRKVHQGQIDKKAHAAEKKRQEEEEKEKQEAAYWSIGAKELTSHDMRLEREKEKQERKKKLEELYKQEMDKE